MALVVVDFCLDWLGREGYVRLKAKNWDAPPIDPESVLVQEGCSNGCPITPNQLLAGLSENLRLCFACWSKAGKPYRERKVQANGISK